jgi:RNA polymerase sigma factor for flagellar operon FliA
MMRQSRPGTPDVPASEAVSPAPPSADDLVLEHLGLVHQIAAQFAAKMPAHVDPDDLVQAGLLGLVTAARRCAAGREHSFRAYAGMRIRGAMLDEARRADWVPRSIRRGIREVQHVAMQLERREGQAARPAEVARSLGLSLDAYHRLVQDAVASRILSLEEASEGPQQAEVQTLADESRTPLAQLERHCLLAAVATAVRALPRRLRRVVALYYGQELTLREIGELLSVSESRVCQLLSQATTEIRRKMQAWTVAGSCGAAG